MNKFNFTIYFILLLCSFAAAQVKVYIKLPGEIYVNETFNMNVVAENSKSAPEVDVSELSEFNPSFLGASTGSSSSRIVINGKVIEDKTEFVSKWNLTVNKEGTYTLGPLNVTVDGKNMKTDPVQFVVRKPDTTDELGIEASLSSTECYVGQPVQLSVKWYIPPNLSSFDFSIPTIMDESLFSVGNLQPPGNGGDSQEINNTSIGNLVASVTRGQYQNKPCRVVSFNKYLVPKQTGDIEISPISVNCQLVYRSTNNDNNRRRGGFFDDPFFDSPFNSNKTYKRFQANASPLNLKVKPLPEQGKPNGFYGLVGTSYFISSELVNAPVTITVGTPLTLKITVSGNNGFLDDVKMPDLSFMSDRFKIPTDFSSPEREKGSLIFTQTIRPTKSTENGLVEIPPIPLHFFNYQLGKYATEQSDPIPIQVEGARKIVEADVRSVVTTEPDQSGGTELEKIEHRIAANHFGDEILVNTTFSVADCFRSFRWLIAMGLPTVILLLTIISAAAGNKDPEKIAAKQAGKAYGKAAGGLAKLNESNAESYLEGLNNVLRQYIADKFKHNAQSLTGQDCKDLLVNAGVSSDYAERYKSVVELFEHSRYAGAASAGNVPGKQEVLELIKSVNKEIK